MRLRSLAIHGLLLVCLSAVGKPQEATENSAIHPLLDLTPDVNGGLSQEQMRQLFRVVADNDIESDKRRRDYTYVEREVENQLDGKGQAKSTEIRTYEILE